MSIITPDSKSQEAMQAKTQAIPPRVREEISPLPSGGTEGQVLTMGETEAEWDDIPSQLPEGGTAGQVLTLEVPEGETDPVPAWADAPKELPELSNKSGRVLTVNSNATGVEWKAPVYEHMYKIQMVCQENTAPEMSGEYKEVTLNSSYTKYYIDGQTLITGDTAAVKELLFRKNPPLMTLIFNDGGDTFFGYIAGSQQRAVGRVYNDTGMVAYDVVAIPTTGSNFKVIVGKTVYTAAT